MHLHELDEFGNWNHAILRSPRLGQKHINFILGQEQVVVHTDLGEDIIQIVGRKHPIGGRWSR